MTTREQLIQWAAYCNGLACAADSFSGPEYDRARAMSEAVDAATHTAADRIQFYLRFVQGCPKAVVTAAARWHWLHRKARWSNRYGDPLSRDRFLEALVFELTYPDPQPSTPPHPYAYQKQHPH